MVIPPPPGTWTRVRRGVSPTRSVMPPERFRKYNERYCLWSARDCRRTSVWAARLLPDRLAAASLRSVYDWSSDCRIRGVAISVRACWSARTGAGTAVAASAPVQQEDHRHRPAGHHHHADHGQSPVARPAPGRELLRAALAEQLPAQ
ncbi:hypothetical protein SALBM311S_11652 [Streptomyces alboniger]